LSYFFLLSISWSFIGPKISCLFTQ
jgi:hypothetical protein